MKISEIKDKGLRELAELRRDERNERDKRVYVELECDLGQAFWWKKTKEGLNAWEMVNNGEITTLYDLTTFLSKRQEKERKPKEEPIIAELTKRVYRLEQAVLTKDDSEETHTEKEPQKGDVVYMADNTAVSMWSVGYYHSKGENGKFNVSVDCEKLIKDKYFSWDRISLTCPL
jgi:hypothetical protein